MWCYVNPIYLYELYHHGIKGMKWGVKNGPPYPLDSKNIRSASKRDEKRMVGGVEEIVMATAALTITAAVAYVKRRNAKKQTEKIKSAHTMESDLTAVNPKFAEGVNYQMNCAYCTAAYELRRRGFDIEVLPRPVPTSEKDIAAMYKEGKFSKLREKDKFAEMTKEAENWGDGARGSVAVYFGPGIGHIFSVEVQNGKASFLDPQAGGKYENGKLNFFNPNTKKTDLLDLQNNITSASIIRTDNLELSDNIIKTVKKRAV